MADKKDMLSDLNAEQREAVTSIDGPIVIVAGAGTGKTKTLVSRVSYLISQGIDPESILLVTFTNKAADEMCSRIAASVGEDSAGKVTACTFHSFCSVFLRRNAHWIDFPVGYTIIDSDDAVEAVKIFRNERRKELAGKKINCDDFPTAAEILDVYSYAINNMIPVSDACEACMEYTEYRKDVENIIKEYRSYKKARGMMDYDDLLYYTYLILSRHEPVRKFADEHYKYIMCDEYQDTNAIQDALLDLLSRDYRNLCVVGDDNQSIYRFRGAKVENMLTFKDRYPGAKQIVLYQNYRSSEEILTFCNAVMGHATEGIEKTLHGQFHGEKPTFDIHEDQWGQASAIADMVREYNDAGISLSDMAVIVRASFQSAAVEAELTKRGIPFVKIGGQKFWSRSIVRNIIAFLRASCTDTDELAWLMVSKIYPYIGEVNARKIAAEIRENGMEQFLENSVLRKKNIWPSAKEACDTVAMLRDMSLMEKLQYLIDDYYEDLLTRYCKASRRSDSSKREFMKTLQTDLRDVRVMIDLAKGYKSTRSFLDDMALSFANPDTVKGEPLNITTIHSAKGLEYDTVFLLNPLEGVFPRCTSDDPDDPEELRCLYVALTRAKHHLHISLTQMSSTYNSVSANQLSHHLNYPDVLEAADYDEDEMEPLLTGEDYSAHMAFSFEF